MFKIFAKIISLDWEHAIFAYNIRQAGFVSVELTAPDGAVRSYRSSEAVGTGRLKLDDLEADCSYSGKFLWNKKEIKFGFKTLPKPEGEMLGAFSVIADPHLSCRLENRKGRLLVESAMLLDDVVKQCNVLHNDFILLPGDITNKGLETEYAASQKILSQLQAPYMAVAGNHDVDSRGERDALWQAWFGGFEHVMETDYALFLGLDTSRGGLNPSSIAILEKALQQKKMLCIFTHYQLFDNIDINQGTTRKIINNAASCKQLLDKLTRIPSIIYAGHQNVPSVKTCNKAVQINMPQPVQYPCGFTYVRCYANGFYHTFMPISSEVMRQYSLYTGNQAAEFYNEPQWEGLYREGKSIEQLNFIVKGKHHVRQFNGDQYNRIRRGKCSRKLTAVS
ncbi:MAG: metallophosphoesterase [Victivallaceae bacterium]